MRHLSRFAASALVLLAACAPDGARAPAFPTSPSARLTTDVPPSCDPSGIRQTMAGVYATTDLKSFALPTFNEAESQRATGDVAGARLNYYRVIAHLVDRYKQNVLLSPSTLPTTADGVYYVTASIIDCADARQVDNLKDVVFNIAGNAVTQYAPNTPAAFYQLCPIVDVGTQTTCVAPNTRAAVVLPPNFVSRPALLLIEPASAVDPFFNGDYGSIWTNRWRIRVEPPSAQAPLTPATVAVCAEEQSIVPAGFHPPVGYLQLAEAPEDGSSAARRLAITGDATALGLLESCHPQTASAAREAGTPFGDSYAARRGWYAVAQAAHNFVGMIAPKPAYAFDGGVGGKTSLFQSYFSGIEVEELYLRRDGDAPTTAPLTALTMPTSSSATLRAPRTAYGMLKYPTSCSPWTSSHNRLSIVNSAGPQGQASVVGVITSSKSNGDATVSARCTYTRPDGSVKIDTASVVVTVVR